MITTIIILVVAFYILKFYKKNNNKTIEEIERDKYYQEKQELFDTAIADTVFFDAINVFDLEENKKCFEQWICPYCGAKLPERKGANFKCLKCNQKVHNKSLFVEGNGLFTDEQSEIINELKKEINKRKTIIKLWKQASELVLINFIEDKSKNIWQIIKALNFARLEYYKIENLYKLRECRFIQGELLSHIGEITQATNAYMQILYLDCIIDFEDFKSYDFTIAEGILNRAFFEDLPIDKFEKIFLFYANILDKQIKHNKKITPEKAWKKIKENINNN